MNTVKREACSQPMNDQKRRREGAPSVKKVNFRRSSNCVLTTDHAKDNKNQKTSGLKVKRSRRSKQRSSHSSCSESEVDGKNSELSKSEKQPAGKCEKSLTGVAISEQKNFCSTPVRRGNGIQDCASHVSASIQIEQAFERHTSSPFGAGIKSVLDNCYSSFYGDDSALAALNLSEIITSSAASVPAQHDNCTSSMKEESNQFYGLPLQVKELLQKYKGIESLYGKNVRLATW